MDWAVFKIKTNPKEVLSTGSADIVANDCRHHLYFSKKRLGRVIDMALEKLGRPDEAVRNAMVALLLRNPKGLRRYVSGGPTWVEVVDLLSSLALCEMAIPDSST